jgi:DNA-binding CsgD family transcriptional regulator
LGGAPILNAAAPPVLTDREVEVLASIAAGLSSAEVGARLHVSGKDVEYHVHNLLSKFETRNRTGLVSRAFALGYLSADDWPPEAQRQVC